MIWQILPVWIPLIVIGLSFLISLNRVYHEKMQWYITFGGLFVALILNALLLGINLQFSSSYPYSFFSIRTDHLIFIIFQQGILLLGTLATPRELNHSHSKGLINPIYLLASFGFNALFLTENILLITIFWLIVTHSSYLLFFFGREKKDPKQLRIYQITELIGALILVICNIVCAIQLQTVNLVEIRQLLPLEPLWFQVVFILGYCTGIGCISGILPWSIFHLKPFFQETNSLALRTFILVYIPSIDLLLMKLLAIPPRSIVLYGYIVLASTFLGLLLWIISFIMEILGHWSIPPKSIPCFLGILGVIGFNFSFCFALWDRFFTATDSGKIFQLYIQYVIITCLILGILIEGIAPVFITSDNWSLANIYGLGKKYFPNIIYLVGIPGLLIIPGSIFVDIIATFGEFFLNIDNFTAGEIIFFTLSCVAFIIFLIFLVLFVAVSLIKIYFIPISSTEKAQTPSSLPIINRNLTAPIIFIILVILASIFAPKLFFMRSLLLI